MTNLPTYQPQFKTADVKSYSDYYPFGMQMPGRNGSQGDGYRYGFQGQEKDNEIKGEGNSINYKYRMHDPRIGRFFAVDPLASKYPHNGPYNFSENIVLHAIELEGLEAFFIHGTDSDWYRWIYNAKDEKEMTLVRGLTEIFATGSSKDWGFSWKVDEEYTNWLGKKKTRKLNHLRNNTYSRFKAAKLLTKYVMDNRKKDENGNYEPITLIGHSHGGNVSIQAVDMISKKCKCLVNVVTIATPAYNGEMFNSENPDNQKGLGTHYHIYNEIDAVDYWADGNETYTNDKTVNIEVDASRFYSNSEWIDAHSFDSDYPQAFLNELNESLEKLGITP